MILSPIRGTWVQFRPISVNSYNFGKVVSASWPTTYCVLGPVVPTSAFRAFRSGPKRYADSWWNLGLLRGHLRSSILGLFCKTLPFACLNSVSVVFAEIWPSTIVRAVIQDKTLRPYFHDALTFQCLISFDPQLTANG